MQDKAREERILFPHTPNPVCRRLIIVVLITVREILVVRVVIIVLRRRPVISTRLKPEPRRYVCDGQLPAPKSEIGLNTKSLLQAAQKPDRFARHWWPFKISHRAHPEIRIARSARP